MSSDSTTDADVLLLGAGLACSLIALRLKARRPELRVRLLEAKSGPDDDHTWCCFDSDLDADQRAWLRPLQSNNWPAYVVKFPQVKRRVPTGYGRLTSRALADAVEAALPGATAWGADVIEATGDSVRLADGRTLRAPLVIDGRGARPSPAVEVAWQKFVGLEVETVRPHGVSLPVVMDATVPQLDGFRFLYVLPLDARRLLIEDTRYADGATLDERALADEVRAYAARNGWEIVREARVETGALPILLDGDFDAYWRGLPEGPVPVGMAALLFQPTTGYSLPNAARLADRIAGQADLSAATVRALVAREAEDGWRRGAYLRLLNRMLFRAAAPDQRWRVLQRFYRLPDALIGRFYANRLTWADRLRILSGRPPVPIGAAVRAMLSRSNEAPVG